jgi:hypothetical protein
MPHNTDLPMGCSNARRWLRLVRPSNSDCNVRSDEKSRPPPQWRLAASVWAVTPPIVSRKALSSIAQNVTCPAMNGGDTRRPGPGSAPSLRRDDSVCDGGARIRRLPARRPVLDFRCSAHHGDRRSHGQGGGLVRQRTRATHAAARLGRVRDRLQVGFGTGELRQGWSPPLRRQSVDPARFWAARSIRKRRKRSLRASSAGA